MQVRLAVFCTSAAVLAYEILLMRLLTITQWHHFAYMIISIALLGFGASGTFVALTQDYLLGKYRTVFGVNSMLFSLTVVLGFVSAQRVNLNPLEILWDPKQWIYLVQTYLFLFLPFFFAANCISLTFARFKEEIHRIYLYDLVGAGTGALGSILLLSVFFPLTCLKLLTMPGFIAAGLVNMTAESSKARRATVFFFVAGILVLFAWPHSWLNLNISQYKGLSTALRMPDARIVAERSSALGWLSVVESPTIPFRQAPGMSLNCTVEPPPQLAVFVDGDSQSPITRYDGKRESLRYLDCLTSALPYHMLEKPEVLVLGAGGGADVLMGLYHGAKRVDAVELDPAMVALVREDFAGFDGDLYGRDEVHVHVGEARGFVAGTPRLFDVIQISLLDSYNASAAGGYALTETYLYTVEALEQYFRHLRAGGFLCITRWLKVPPRDSLKLFGTALDALKESGVAVPAKHLALIRGWKTSTLVVKHGEITDPELDSLRKFCRERSFDVCYFPGIRKSDTNRFNLLDEPYFYEGALALLGRERQVFQDRYKFDIIPATDNRPYFHHFFKWRILPEIMALKSQGGLPLIEWAYPILILTLLQALVVSLILILAPLALGMKLRNHESGHTGTIVYFLSLGLAFLFIEIAFIQKFTLFLSHPLYAVSVVLAGFLIFAGLGSRFSGIWKRAASERGSSNPEGMFITICVVCIGIISGAYVALLPMLFRHLMALSDTVKVAMSIGLIAPLAFFMGMPFPLGLSLVAKRTPAFVPWAWGINGCASVLSAVLATILAIHLGFNGVVGLAVMLYALAAAIFRSL